MSLPVALAFVIPALGAFGQSVATTYFVFALSCLYKIRPTIPDIKAIAKEFRLEIVFLFWLFITCFWSIHITKALTSFFKLLLYCGLSFALFYYRKKFAKHLSGLQKFIFLGFAIGLIFFYTEFLSAGFLTQNFRSIMGIFGIKDKVGHLYYLHLLDKGCSFLAILTWPCTLFFLNKNKPTWGAIFYLFVLFTLYKSDSLSGFVALFVSGIVFIIMRYIRLMQKPIIPITILIVGATIQIILFYMMDPWYLAENYEFSQLSMIHRLFIWNYVALKSANEFVFGYGFTSSKFFPVPQTDYIYFKGVELMPLPLHPHNNILQILFENGLIGLSLYLAICCRYIKLIAEGLPAKILQKNPHLVPCGYAYFTAYFIVSMIAFSTWQSWWLAAALFSGFVLAYNFDEKL